MLGVVAALVIGSAEAHDPDHHEQAEWYQSLMQPDAPTSSCCGEADAYWADEIHVRNGKTYATITDDRPDEPRIVRISTSGPRSRSRTTSSSGTNRIQRDTASRS
jgi:hypothetical protein